MFWGISLENGKKYSQVVNHSFHVTMAALEPLQGVKKENLNVTVMIEHQKLEYVLCTLNHVKCLQQTLDLNFIEGEEVIFYTNGHGIVHMTGYHMLDMDSIMQGEEDSDDSLLEEEGEDLSDDEEVATQVLMNGSNLEVSDSDDQDWANDKSMKRKKSKSEKKQSADGKKEFTKLKDNTKLIKKIKDELDDDEEDESDDDSFEFGNDEAMDDSDDEEEESEEEEVLVKKSPPTKENAVQGTPQSKKRKIQESETIKVSTPKQSANESLNNSKLKSSAKKLIGGTMSTDIKIGKGPVAKKGKNVHVYYTGTLANGKEFDQCSSGKPFKFRLGSGDVIKGWELGLEGMRIGGKRNLVVPPSQGYGNKIQGPIPRNSTLHFDIELKAIS